MNTSIPQCLYPISATINTNNLNHLRSLGHQPSHPSWTMVERRWSIIHVDGSVDVYSSRTAYSSSPQHSSLKLKKSLLATLCGSLWISFAITPCLTRFCFLTFSRLSFERYWSSSSSLFLFNMLHSMKDRSNRCHYPQAYINDVVESTSGPSSGRCTLPNCHGIGFNWDPDIPRFWRTAVFYVPFLFRVHRVREWSTTAILVTVTKRWYQGRLTGRFVDVDKTFVLECRTQADFSWNHIQSMERNKHTWTTDKHYFETRGTRYAVSKYD